MKKRWADEEAVSPVIATILMVAITVVLAAVLYVMVIGMPSDTGNAELPIGLAQQTRTDKYITVLIASAPETAYVYGSIISMFVDGNPTAITNATLYYSNGTVAATFSNSTWDIDINNLMKYDDGMQINIVAPAIHNGDKIMITGEGFGTTVMTVN